MAYVVLQLNQLYVERSQRGGGKSKPRHVQIRSEVGGVACFLVASFCPNQMDCMWKGGREVEPNLNNGMCRSRGRWKVWPVFPNQVDLMWKVGREVGPNLNQGMCRSGGRWEVRPIS